MLDECLWRGDVSFSYYRRRRGSIHHVCILSHSGMADEYLSAERNCVASVCVERLERVAGDGFSISNRDLQYDENDDLLEFTISIPREESILQLSERWRAWGGFYDIDIQTLGEYRRFRCSVRGGREVYRRFLKNQQSDWGEKRCCIGIKGILVGAALSMILLFFLFWSALDENVDTQKWHSQPDLPAALTLLLKRYLA